MQRTIEQARQIVADYWRENNEPMFAREVLAGCWDHRGDVQAALAGTFKPKAHTFKQLAVGESFSCNGNNWVKRSTRTASGIWPACLPEWSYFKGSERIGAPIRLTMPS